MAALSGFPVWRPTACLLLVLAAAAVATAAGGAQQQQQERPPPRTSPVGAQEIPASPNVIQVWAGWLRACTHMRRVVVSPINRPPPVLSTRARMHACMQLNELTFRGRTSDGRVWMVELYANWCRGCRRVGSQVRWMAARERAQACARAYSERARLLLQVSQLADELAGSRRIAIARLECSQAEAFCSRDIGVTRTPSFKVCSWPGAHARTHAFNSISWGVPKGVRQNESACIASHALLHCPHCTVRIARCTRAAVS